ncbi:hypothetical protein [Aquifex aeolicus]|uniref:hypothetical protein n=1 Tax=Aquifex aeolicus TaxID=63363 RepID=UPI0002DAB62F|nr:hypothetical protein [Aquifex aeolicus]
MEDRKIEAIKERIRFYTEAFKTLLIISATLTGGIAGLLFKLNSPTSVFLIVVGLIIDVILISVAIKLYLNIEELFRRIEK